FWCFGICAQREDRRANSYGRSSHSSLILALSDGPLRICLALLKTGNYLFQLLLFLLKKSNQKSSPLQRRFSSRTGFSKKYSCFHTPLLDSWVVLVLILFLTYAFHLAPRAGI